MQAKRFVGFRTLVALSALLGLLSCGEATVAPADDGPRPNVLLILVDDLNTQLPIYGNSVVHTPHLEALAARGTVFERAYCQYPVCNPSRSSLLSGLRPEATGILRNDTDPKAFLSSATLLPTHFREHGYQTIRAGKVVHGVANEGAVEWDVVGKLMRPIAKLTVRDRANGEAGSKEPEAASPRSKQQAESEGLKLLTEPWVVKGAAARENLRDHHVASEAARWMKRSQRQDKPFFMALGFHRPHLPFEAPEKFFAMYPPERIELPSAPPSDAPSLPARALHTKNAAPPMTPDEQRLAIASYYASVSYMDSQLGLVLNTLERLGLAENTLVILTSDHGFLLGEHGGLWGKLSLFSEATRVPLVVAGPGVARGGRSRRTVELVDLFPTVSDFAGLPRPPGLAGRSLVPLLADPEMPWAHPAYTVMSLGDKKGGELARSVVSEEYRYTEWGSKNQAELYDLERDPGEQRNLAADPAHVKAKAQMAKLLARREKSWWRSLWPW